MNTRTTSRAHVADERSATPISYQVLVPYAYRHKGEDKTGWTSAGVAFQSRDGQGFNVELRPGIAVSGRLVIRPWRADPTPQAAAAEAAEPRAPGAFIYDRELPKDALV